MKLVFRNVFKLAVAVVLILSFGCSPRPSQVSETRDTASGSIEQSIATDFIYDSKDSFDIPGSPAEVMSYSKLEGEIATFKGTPVATNNSLVEHVGKAVVGSYIQISKLPRTEYDSDRLDVSGVWALKKTSAPWGDNIDYGSGSAWIWLDDLDSQIWRLKQDVIGLTFHVDKIEGERFFGQMWDETGQHNLKLYSNGDNLEIGTEKFSSKYKKLTSMQGYSDSFRKMIDDRANALARNSSSLVPPETARVEASMIVSRLFQALSNGKYDEVISASSTDDGLAFSGARGRGTSEYRRDKPYRIGPKNSSNSGSFYDPELVEGPARYNKIKDLLQGINSDLSDLGFATIEDSIVTYNEFQYVDPSEFLEKYPGSITAEIVRDTNRIVVLVLTQHGEEWRLACIVNLAYSLDR